MRLEVEPIPVIGFKRPTLEIAGVQLHEDCTVIFRDDRGKLEEITDEHDLLSPGRDLGIRDHAHDVIEKVDAAHRDLIDDDDLRDRQDLAGTNLLGRVAYTGAHLKSTVDGRAIVHVERRDTRRRHRRVGNATGLKVIDEPVEHIALARAGVTGKEDVTPLLQGNVGVPLVFGQTLQLSFIDYHFTSTSPLAICAYVTVMRCCLFLRVGNVEQTRKLLLADSKQTSTSTLSRPSAFWRRVGGRRIFPFFPVWAIAAARILSRPLLP